MGLVEWGKYLGECGEYSGTGEPRDRMCSFAGWGVFCGAVGEAWAEFYVRKSDDLDGSEY